MNEEIKARIAAINSGIVPEGYKKTKVGIVPVEWETKQMKRICEINRGGSPRPIEDFLTDGKSGINWIKIGDVSADSKYITHTKERIKLEGVKKSRQVFEGDFLLSNSMSYGRPYILKTAGCIHDGWLVINNYSKFFELDFFYYLLCSESIQRQYDVLSAGSGVQNLNKDLVSEVNVILPPLPEQQKIAEILSTQDKLIELQEKKIEQLKELKKGYLQKMFPKKGSKYPELRFKGFTDAWEQRKLGEVAEKICVGFVGTCEKYYTDTSGIPMYRTGNLNGLKLNQDDLKYVTKEFHEQNKKSQLRKGDILIARHGDSGKAVNYELSEEANCLNIVIIRPDLDKCNYQFLSDSINSPTVSQHIKSLSAGSTQAVINTSEIEKLDIIIPANKEEQNKIAGFLNDLDTLITLHQRKLEEEKQKKKSLMQLLLTGKVRVKI